MKTSMSDGSKSDRARRLMKAAATHFGLTITGLLELRDVDPPAFDDLLATHRAAIHALAGEDA